MNKLTIKQLERRLDLLGAIILFMVKRLGWSEEEFRNNFKEYIKNETEKKTS